MPRSGADLALLLLGGHRVLVDDAMAELAARGHPDFRPGHELAMRVIAAGATSTSELGRRMAVSKQAAAKTVAVLLDRGYVSRDPDPDDARRKRLHVTSSGFAVMRQGEAVFHDLRARWEQRIGAPELAAIKARLATLAGDRAIRVDAPGWTAGDLG